jgi:hypothetical protein
VKLSYPGSQKGKSKGITKHSEYMDIRETESQGTNKTVDEEHFHFNSFTQRLTKTVRFKWGKKHNALEGRKKSVYFGCSTSQNGMNPTWSTETFVEV